MKNNKNLLLLLSPSWLVNFVGVAIGVVVTAGVIIISRYEGSALRQQIFETQANSQPDNSSLTYQYIANNIANNAYIGAAPLLLVWAGIGLLVYFVAVAIIRSFGQAAELRDELDYVHVSRQDLLRQTLMQLAIRALALIGWFVFIKLSLSIFIPYALAAASVASQALSLQSAAYALLAIVVLYVDVCVHAVFLRLITLRSRLFGS